MLHVHKHKIEIAITYFHMKVKLISIEIYWTINLFDISSQILKREKYTWFQPTCSSVFVNIFMILFISNGNHVQVMLHNFLCKQEKFFYTPIIRIQ
jgi:hypothetical protein